MSKLAAPSLLACASAMIAGVGLVGLGYFLGVRRKVKKRRSHQIKLFYWDMTGRAEPIRLAFHLGGVPFEDCRVSKEEFAAMRDRGELLYGQLPIMFVDGKKYAQSIALLRFGGQLSGLYPKCETEALRCDMICDNVQDLVNFITPTFQEYDRRRKIQMRHAFAQDYLYPLLQHFDELLAESRSGFFCNSGLSIADLIVWRNCVWFASGVLDGIPASCIDGYPRVSALMDKVKNLPKIVAYYHKWEAIAASEAAHLENKM